MTVTLDSTDWALLAELQRNARASVTQLAQRGRLDLADQQVDIASDPVAELNLTRRELDVMHLLAEGRTNRQIGESLFISEKTASVHVSNILAKLDAGGRTEAVAIAAQRGLLPTS